MTNEMTEQSFILQPFLLDDALSDIYLEGSIQRQANRLTIHYALSDPELMVSISPTALPARKHNLWQETCFEFFLGVQDSERYWEFNLSPAGHWNVYRFDGYRQGMQDELAWDQLPFKAQQSEAVKSEGATLTLNLDLSPIVMAHQKIELAIAAVIKLKTDAISYWALTHCAPQADFHHRKSFTIEL
jgi:hypothetical protein